MSKKDKKISNNNSLAPRDITTVRQFPTWQNDDKFTITGQEFTELKKYFDLFAVPSSVVNNIFTREINNGTIKTKFLDANNNEFTKEEVTSYINSFAVDKHAEDTVAASE